MQNKLEYLEKVKKGWNADSDTWHSLFQTDEKINEIKYNPACSFHSSTFQMINKFMPDMKGKHVLVPSSGDNCAVFSFAQMGAKVTSSDIAEKQLENAAFVAKRHGWDIEFICDNTMRLENIKSNEYDLVYTSNGVHVWIYDLYSMYQNIHRVLKDAGVCIMYDIHPFIRPFVGEPGNPVIKKSYNDCDTESRFHWRIQDLLNAMISSGFAIKHVEELSAENASFWFKHGNAGDIAKEEQDRLLNWKTNPMAALPQWLSICMKKES